MSLTITKVRNAASLQPDNLRMDVEINHPDYGWIPYTLDPADTDTTVNNDEVMALIGTDFTSYSPPTQAEIDTHAELQVRTERNFILTSVVDPLASNTLRWADLTSDKQDYWSQYRTELLDVPQQSGFPHNVIWPNEPE